jgi:DNA-binding transcriptional ArsR family regulator
MAKALSHPLRLRVLQELTLKGEGSPVQVAGALGERLGNVSYHMRILHELGCVELVRTEPRRGAVEHFYRPVLLPFADDAQWERLPVAVRRQLAGQTLGHIVRSAAAAAGAGGFDRSGAHVVWAPLALDAEGWQELSALLLGVLERSARIQADSDARNRAGDKPIARSELAILHFAVDSDEPAG